MFSLPPISQASRYWSLRRQWLRILRQRLSHRVGAQRARWRISALNRHPGVRIDASASIDARSIIDLDGDGYNAGGKVSIGPRCRLAIGALVAPYGGEVRLGEHVYIGPYSVIYGHGGVVIGDDVLIAAHCTIIPANHTWTDAETPIFSHPVRKLGIEIQAGVWLGAGVKVLDGVCIGRGTVVGAGAVVTKSLPPLVIAVGVPARILRAREPRTAEGYEPT